MLAYLLRRVLYAVPIMIGVPSCASCSCTSHPAIRWCRYCRLTPPPSCRRSCASCTASTVRCPSSLRCGCGAHCTATWRVDREQPRSRLGSVHRSGQHAAARGGGHLHRLRAGQPVRLRRGLLPRLLARPAGLDVLRARRERAALLAGHGDGDRVLVAAHVAAGHRRGPQRLGRLGVGLGAPAVPAAARDHDVGDSDGHHRAHGARAGGRDPGAGVHRRPARQGAHALRRVPPHGEERGAHGAGRDGAATGLPARWLDPHRDGVLLAGHGLPAELGHLPARPAAAAGHDPGAGAVLRRAQPAGRRAADLARPRIARA
ncbi:hypothetical protein DdX_21709 [Ditylenchus destructor]|uniref:Uncharacterized protein n=1 Tax=Ditylenchus destructor TaxID=166010 RepID=A0AAD4MJA3_9BILA|nr:hypothetical protein DdX_21709 [Ditylenchus destructor]